MLKRAMKRAKPGLGKALRDKRRQADLTQEQLGFILGLPKPVISNYETGRFSPTRKNKRLIERVLKTDHLVLRSAALVRMKKISGSVSLGKSRDRSQYRPQFPK